MPAPFLFNKPFSNINDTNCTHGVQWIYSIMGDCVEDDLSYASVIIGIASILCWMAVGFPQMYQNCRHGEGVEAISIFFLLQWMFGDSCNLLGAILSKQLPLQIYTAIYFIFNDLVLLTQYTYYRCRNRRKVSELRVQRDGKSQLVLCLGGFFVMSYCMRIPSLAPSKWFSYQTGSHLVEKRHFPAGRNLLSHDLQFSPIFRGPIDESGFALGVLSAFLYVGSRLAQIRNNYKRQSTEGMSVIMFSLAVLGNLTYGLAIFMRSQDAVFLIRHLPWIVGSIGVMGFDIFILSQSFWYKRRNQPTEELGHLLPSDNESDG